MSALLLSSLGVACQSDDDGAEQRRQAACSQYQALMSNAAANEGQLSAVRADAERLLTEPTLTDDQRAALSELIRVAESPSASDEDAKAAVVGLISAPAPCGLRKFVIENRCDLAVNWTIERPVNSLRGVLEAGESVEVLVTEDEDAEVTVSYWVPDGARGTTVKKSAVKATALEQTDCL